MADGPDDGAGHEVPAAGQQRDGARRRDPGLRAAHLVAPLPLVEADRGSGGPPPAPAAIERSRSDQAQPAASKPAGAATGSTSTAAADRSPRWTVCQNSVGAGMRSITAPASQTASIGRHQAAARYRRPGCQPRREATATAPTATSVTGRSPTASKAAAPTAASRRRVPPHGGTSAAAGKARISILAARVPSASRARATVLVAAGAHT